MWNPRWFFPIQSVFVLLLSSLVSLSCANYCIEPLNQSDLREKYGQVNRTFNDGKNCDRKCDGTTMNCYYEFHVQMYDTMSGLCGDCENGAISDCFIEGCVTGNGVARSMITINHQMPGPPIRVCKDDRIIVDVTNHLPGQELSIHWHGLHQKETPWSDGVPMVTQCPIMSGNTFRYIFFARQAGTHYYHSHSGLQRTNGVIGKLDVRDPFDPNESFYDYDLTENSILLSDWDNEMAEEKAPGAKNQVVLPASILINGFGTYFDSKSMNFTFAPIAVFYVERGKRHRFRIDNAASFSCPFELSIKNHKLTVIATDGYSIEPVVVDSLVTAAGERYDVIMNADNDPDATETLLTIRALTQCRHRKLQEFARIIFVDDILNYSPSIEYHRPLEDRPAYESLDVKKTSLNNPTKKCTDVDNICVAALQQKLVESSVGGDLRNESAKTISFELRTVLGQDRSGHYINLRNSTAVGTINNISSSFTPVLGLLQDDSTVPYCNDNNLPARCDRNSVCHCPHLVELKLCEVYEFVLIEPRDQKDYTNGVPHPVHLHGYGFQVVDMGSYSQYKNNLSDFSNAKHLPPIKDTIIVPFNGFVKLRFKACNPGYWLLHCHLEHHMHIGMTVTIKVGSSLEMLRPPVGFPTCGHFLVPIY